MPAVSNTSPISNLAMIGRLQILRGQLETVVIPNAVFLELERIENLKAKEAIASALADGWLQVKALEDQTLVNVLCTSLDAGESEAIALARTMGANLLVMDESAGRAMARSLGLQVTGTLGVLLKAKRAGHLPSLGDEIDRLVGDAGFFVSARVRQFFIEAAGEA